MAVPPIIILALIMCGTPIVLALLALVAREISARRVTTQGLSNEEIARRLERIEHTVDATALEVERLAESSRFLTKLLADKSSASGRDHTSIASSGRGA